jgi:hypothetical protein
MSTFTITFGEVAENHVCMQQIGTKAARGLSLKDLQSIAKVFPAASTEIVPLHTGVKDAAEAYILVVRNGVHALGLDSDKLLDEQKSLSYDKKALMYGRVVNKHARWNLCFSNVASEANIAAGRGTVVAFTSVPLLSLLRDCLQCILDTDAVDFAASLNPAPAAAATTVSPGATTPVPDNKMVISMSHSDTLTITCDVATSVSASGTVEAVPALDTTVAPSQDATKTPQGAPGTPLRSTPITCRLQAEGNYYYDSTCGIGYHGDTERKIVIAVRLGASIPLQFQWYRYNYSVGTPIRIDLAAGDIYFMSEKATGNDWKTRSMLTLRHAAGAAKYLR